MTIEPTEAAEALAADAPVPPDSPTFAELGVRPETVTALAAAGIERAFAIQQYAVPIGMRGVDLIGQAPTGTGKTLGFGIPLLERVISPAEGASGRPQALVVVPTRELGLQVARDIAAAGATRGVRVLPVYGGVAYEPQTAALVRGVEIVVGTPGRLLDLAKGKQLKFDGIQALVLDEADRMLDLGFLEDVERILAMLPTERQTMLFSATMPDPIVALARRFLHQPMTVHAGHDVNTGPSPLTEQLVYRTHSLNKSEVVTRILQARGRGLTMVFTRTKRAADRLAEDLDFRGFAVAAVHGDLGQGSRERALRAFRAGKIDILVATDVAARGLDVTGVTHVINYDCPEDADAYVHRIGRTGRAGATGVAVTFVDWEDLPRWQLIDKSLQLEMPDPPETYHTSAWLLSDLDIPEDAGTTLSTADRTRAGLSAEILEDVEGKAGRGRRRPRSDRVGTRTAASPLPETAPTDSSARRRRRRKLDDGGPDAAASTDEAVLDPAASGQVAERPRRRARRSTAAASAATAPPATAPTATPPAEAAAVDAAPGDAASGGGGAPLGGGAASIPQVAFIDPAGASLADSGPGDAGEATPAPPARRRRRRTAAASGSDSPGSDPPGSDSPSADE